jgi:hypothetical protein
LELGGGTFFLSWDRGWLGALVFPLLLSKPGGFIESWVNGRRDGFVLGGDNAFIRDQAFDGDDHGDGLDLGGHAAARRFGVHVGDFPEAAQDLVAAHIESGQFAGILLDQLLLNCGPVCDGAGTLFLGIITPLIKKVKTGRDFYCAGTLGAQEKIPPRRDAGSVDL